MSAPPTALFVADFWRDHLAAHHRQGVFLVLIGFVGSFAFIRMSTRMIRAEVSWWPGNIESKSGVHVHHLVFGIVTMMIAGTLGAATAGDSPWLEITSLFFGIGAGLTMDEFALWFYLEDVYWSQEGRSSIDAAVISASLIGLAVVGSNPFEFGSGFEEIAYGIASAAVLISLVGVCFLKGRWAHGIAGIFVPPLALYGACRLGKPNSPWGHRRYGKRRPEKQARAEARFNPDRRTERFKEAFVDIVGGKPSVGVAQATEQAVAATKEAGHEVRAAAQHVVHPEDPKDQG